jgi:proteasome component ECM29
VIRVVFSLILASGVLNLHNNNFVIEEELRSISAITTREISKNASDRFKSVASAIMPTVFYGTFDTNKDISGVWNDVWEEHTAGSSAAVKLYAPEIVDQLSKQLKSASWNAKKQSAMALKAMSEVKGMFSHGQVSLEAITKTAISLTLLFLT